MYSIVQAQKIKQAVERILHVPGNFTGDILEFAIILDHSVECGRMKECATGLAKVLKGHSEVFRNARLNIIDWCSDKDIRECTVPLSVFMLGGYFDSYVQNESDGTGKTAEELLSFLRLYQSRSKLVILLSDGCFAVEDRTHAAELMHPFLERKTMALWIDRKEDSEWPLPLRTVIEIPKET